MTRAHSPSTAKDSSPGRPRDTKLQDEELPDNTVIANRYRINRLVGRGGMGIVYEATDRTLGRLVALKVLRGESGDDARDRLKREAQILASINHPNVLAVFDVVPHSHHLVVAMDFHGLTLTRWLDGQRTWRDIVDLFVQVGDGIAAAHAEGLVHRDIKPDNILIGADGRPRLSDFGLAERPDAAGGHAVGTPGYMAPEQARRHEVDSRADQFAFCAALFQALYERLPFPDWTTDQKLVLSQPAGTDVPPHVWRVLERGLAENPRDRFPSMVQLLAALRDDPELRARQRMVSGGVALAVVALGGLSSWAIFREAPAVTECKGQVQAGLERIWGDDRRAKIEAAFAGVPSWPHLQKLLDGELTQWRALSLASCYTKPSPEREALSICLNERRKTLESLSDLFAEADAQVRENALNTVLREVLPVSDCHGSRQAAQAHASDAVQEDAMRSRLSRLRVLTTAGHYDEALEGARALADEAETASAREVMTEAKLLLAELGTHLRLPDADQAAHGAIVAAEEIGKDELRLRGWIAIVSWSTDHPRQHVRGRRAADIARALLTRLRSQPLLEAALDSAEGALDSATGRRWEAVTRQKRALELRLDNLPPDHPLVSESRTALGLALPPEQGLPLVLAELENARRLYGPEHPETARALHNLGRVRMSLEEYLPALELFDQELRLREKNRAENPRADVGRLGRAQTARGRALWELSKLDEAKKSYEQGVELLGRAGADPYEQYDELTKLIELCKSLRDEQCENAAFERRKVLGVEE